MDRLIDDNGRLTTCQVVLGNHWDRPVRTLATRPLQFLTTSRSSLTFFVFTLCLVFGFNRCQGGFPVVCGWSVIVHVFCAWSLLSRHLLTTNYELFSKLSSVPANLK